MIGVISAAGSRVRGNLLAVPYSVSAAGADITFTITSASAYVGVEWGLSGYQWSAFDAEAGTAHTLTIGAADGVASGQTYSWRFYETTDPLDSPDARTYTYSGTVST